MMVAIGDILSVLASSDNGEGGEDEDDKEIEWWELSEDDEPGWVMGTFTKIVKQRMERFRQKQMKLEELKHLGWDDAADYFCARDKKYGTSELRFLPVIQPQMDVDAVAPPPTTIRTLVESLDIVHRISQMPQRTSRQGRSHIRLG